jgi:uncharacterized protein (TIGR03000 family)
MLPPYQPAEGAFSLDRLLFQYRGVVDVHAAGYGETAFPRGGEGGLFTLAVVDELRRLRDSTADWRAVFDRIKSTTDRMYVEYRRAVLTSDKVPADDKRVYREQPHQTPVAITRIDQVNPLPPPPLPTAPATATILVHVPAGAKVFVEDRPTVQGGTDRYFETAKLLPGRSYTYAIRAQEDREGRATSQVKRVTVRAGETAEVRFSW